MGAGCCTTGIAAVPHTSLLSNGWTDDLFPVGETLRVYETLKAIDPAYPVALYFGDAIPTVTRTSPPSSVGSDASRKSVASASVRAPIKA